MLKESFAKIRKRQSTPSKSPRCPSPNLPMLVHQTQKCSDPTFECQRRQNMYNTPELGWGHHSCGGVGQIGRYTQSARRISWKTKFPVNAMCKSIAWETSLTPVGNRVLVQDINVKPLQVGAAEVEYKWWMSCNVHPSPEGGTTLTKDHPAKLWIYNVVT